MIRISLILLIAACLASRASDAINAPVLGQSASVAQTHVTAELIPESTTVKEGQPFDVILHLHTDEGWHTYWVNPGDAGLATTIKWTLPPGFSAGPIQWPTPEKHDMGPLVTYGYGGDVYLITTITPPKADLPQHFELKARAEWLVCKEECIPGKADLTLPLDSGVMNLRLPMDNKDFFAEARERLPAENTRWEVKGRYAAGPGLVPESLWTQFKNNSGATSDPIGHLYFFPEQNNVLGAKQDNVGHPEADQKMSEFLLALPLEQNGDKPAQISGVLVSDRPLIGHAKAVYIPVFSTQAVDIPLFSASLANSDSAPLPGGQRLPAETASSQGAAAATIEADGGHRPPLQEQTSAATSSTKEAAPPLLIAVLGAAFVGGLILNLMPCVLPVLSLKVFSLMKHAGGNPGAAWLQGVAFTAGVVISFWALAGTLIVLQSAGQHLGWGFQMQNPGFVLALIFIFFLLGLNLFGVFELGASLVGLDARVTGRSHGLFSSFLNGALATLAATPCTAPFMGSSVGFAAQQPPFIALLVFTFVALGMAAPYLLLTIFPGALRFVPKPGAWMEAFKQFMGFLLMATVIFLLYVFSALVGEDQTPWLLAVLLLTSLAAWIYGRWATPMHSTSVRIGAFILALGLLGYAVNWGMTLARATPQEVAPAQSATADGWQPWTPAAVEAALAQGRPVFVDFTAAWCLSCKVNEAVALNVDSVQQAFAQKKVALFKADWTHADPDISKTLRQYHRDGVPLYLLYSPQSKEAPQILPETLTPGIVLEALNRL